MVKSIRRKIDLHWKFLSDDRVLMKELGEAVCEALRPFIPDIDFEIEPREDGAKIHFYSKVNHISLSELLWEVERVLDVETPFVFSCSVPREVAMQVKEVLKQLLSDDSEGAR